MRYFEKQALNRRTMDLKYLLRQARTANAITPSGKEIISYSKNSLKESDKLKNLAIGFKWDVDAKRWRTPVEIKKNMKYEKIDRLEKERITRDARAFRRDKALREQIR